MPKLSPVQAALLQALELTESKTVRRWPGGFWAPVTMQNKEVWEVWLRQSWLERGLAPDHWGAQTIASLERKGLLQPSVRPARFDTPRELTRLAYLYLNNRGIEDIS